MRTDISQIYGRMSKDPDWMGLGHIAMTVVGGNLAESHCERCISAANLIMTDGKTLMGDELLEQLCVLRMNRRYMQGAKLRFKARYAKHVSRLRLDQQGQQPTTAPL